MRALGLTALLAVTTLAGAQPPSLKQDSLGIPFRVRDYTFPAFLVLGFAPAPATPLGRDNWAVELHYSIVNNFQASQAVEDYLQRSRGNGRRALDEADVAYILGLPQGEAFYIDGEFSMLEFAFHWGVSRRIDVGLGIHYIRYGGRLLDDVIYGFHDAVGVGQSGRQYVPDDYVQVVLGRDGDQDVVLLERPSQGGFGDPGLYVRYTLPQLLPDWRGSLELGLKVPLMNETDFLSTGSWDLGYQVTIERRFSRDAWMLNFGAVFPGKFKQTNFRPPNLPFVNITWIHRFQRWTHTRSFVQALLAEHPYRAIVDSELSDLQFQLTGGFKWETGVGVVGVGLTENVLNFDNTPDIGLHFTWELVR